MERLHCGWAYHSPMVAKPGAWTLCSRSLGLTSTSVRTTTAMNVCLTSHRERMQPWRSGLSHHTVTNMTATTHIIEGGAGCAGHHEPLRMTDDLPPWIAFRTTAIGFSRLTLANATHLRWRRVSTAEFIDDGIPRVAPGTVVDDVWLEQHSHGPFL